jgi:recombination protein RecA
MAKAKKEEDVKMSFKEKCAALDKFYNKTDKERIFIPTGSIGYDWALGGGYQTGRIYEFISWEGAGKTTLSLHAVAECQKLGLNAMYIDAEHALDRKYAERIGVEWEKMGKFQPDFGEQGFDYIKSILNNGDVSLIVIDSTSGLLPKKMIDDPTGTSNLGLHARMLGPEWVKLQTLADSGNCAIIVISQIREKIGIMFGSPETVQGGNALKFWASGRTELRRELQKEGDDVLGIIAKFKVIKNKVVSPYRTGRIPIKFGEGIQKLEELMILGNQYEVIKKHGDGVKILKNDQKYTVSEFYSLLNDNEEFKKDIISDITKKMNDDGGNIDITDDTNGGN